MAMRHSLHSFFQSLSALWSTLTRHLQVCSAHYQSKNTNYTVKKPKAKENWRAPPCWTWQTLFLCSAWPPLHVCLEPDISKGLQQAMTYERWRSGGMEVRLFYRWTESSSSTKVPLNLFIKCNKNQTAGAKKLPNAPFCSNQFTNYANRAVFKNPPTTVSTISLYFFLSPKKS